MRYIIFIISVLAIPYVCHADMLIGEETVYTIKKGDGLILIGARLGVNWRAMAKENSIDWRMTIHPGKPLRVNTQKIVPKEMENGIVVNIPDRMLYFFKNRNLRMALPVGLGMPEWRDMTEWRTPEGKFTVLWKDINPTWYVPLSIQKKMQILGHEVKTIVLPGPDNPLGKYVIKLSIPGIMIHETIWPTSVYQFESHGCIRVLLEHMQSLFDEVTVGTKGEIIYMPVKVAVIKGRVFLEVHNDIYGKIKDMKALANDLIEKAGVSDRIDRQDVERMLKEKTGIAEDITFNPLP
ncbi:MAG: L,D-transpeptidase family protein [Nitrospirae bacterium]|nr:L,D-transpeptidase family protein [Nitrospirota bacterium]